MANYVELNDNKQSSKIELSLSMELQQSAIIVGQWGTMSLQPPKTLPFPNNWYKAGIKDIYEIKTETSKRLSHLEQHISTSYKLAQTQEDILE